MGLDNGLPCQNGIQAESIASFQSAATHSVNLLPLLGTFQHSTNRYELGASWLQRGTSEQRCDDEGRFREEVGCR